MHKSREAGQARRGRALTAAALLLAVSVGLSARGGGPVQNLKTSTPASQPEPEHQEKIAQLEAKSGLPVLDRMPTLSGLDTDGDGVREDIAEYIEHKYTDLAQRRAAMQMARAYQAMLVVDTRDAVAVAHASEAGMRAANCLASIFPTVNEFKSAHEMSSQLESMTTNTKDRLKAYIAFNKAVSGSVSVVPEGNTCE